LKVIAPYAEGDAHYQVGDELFITGKEQMIYFPRPEHAIVRYGDQDIHYAVAIPAGEARYVLDRLTGHIGLQRGPCMFLPDPRKHIIVKRVLDPKLTAIWFPGAANLGFGRRKAQSGHMPPTRRHQATNHALHRRHRATATGKGTALEKVLSDSREP
jgi:major vault protein